MKVGKRTGGYGRRRPSRQMSSKSPDTEYSLFALALSELFSHEANIRHPTLKIDLSSVKIHYVSAATYEMQAHEVRRHQVERKRGDISEF